LATALFFRVSPSPVRNSSPSAPSFPPPQSTVRPDPSLRLPVTVFIENRRALGRSPLLAGIGPVAPSVFRFFPPFFALGGPVSFDSSHFVFFFRFFLLILFCSGPFLRRPINHSLFIDLLFLLQFFLRFWVPVPSSLLF